MGFSKCLSATSAFLLVAGAVTAADTVASGKIKSIHADGKTFVLTDSSAKEQSFQLGADLVVNRAGQETKVMAHGLKAGDAIHVGYDKGPLTSTAHFILVQEGKSKNCELMRGNVTSYDSGKKELSFTSENGKSATYALGDALVRVNMEAAKIDNVHIGDHALLILDTVQAKSTLWSVMINRRGDRDSQRHR